MIVAAIMAKKLKYKSETQNSFKEGIKVVLDAVPSLLLILIVIGGKRMEIRYASSNKDAKFYDTERLREEYLIQDLFTPNNIRLVYSHFDRIIVGGICPTTEVVKLEGSKELGSDYFLERRDGNYKCRRSRSYHS